MGEFTVYTNKPPSLNEIVELFNGMTSTAGKFRHELTFFSKEKTNIIFGFIQSYNVYADNDRKIPIPAREVYRNGGPVDDVLIFKGEKAIAQLSKLGIHTHGQGEENVPATITKALRRAFAAIGPEQISIEGGNITIHSQEDSQQHQQSEMMALLKTIEDYNKTNHSIFGNAVLNRDETPRILLAKCSKQQLEELAGLGLRFPGHELRERLYNARRQNDDHRPAH